MNGLEDFTGSLRSNLSSLLPVLLIALIGVANTFFFVTSVFPQWQTYQQRTAQVEAGREAIAQREPQTPDDTLQTLQSQVDRAQADLNEAASPFMTDEQGEGVLERLYVYARESGVEITNLQAQQTTQANGSGSYETRAFRLQVQGAVPWLMNFVMRIREATLPSVVISNLNIAEGEPEARLTMDMMIYVSPHASGEALASLPEVSIPTPAPPLLLTPVPDVTTGAASEAPAVDGGAAATPDAPSAENAGSEAMSTPPSASIPGRVINATQLNVRYGPGQEWPVLDRLNRDDVVQIVGRNADSTWGVLINGGWVSLEYIGLARPDWLPLMPVVEAMPPSQVE